MPGSPIILALDRNARNLELLKEFLGKAGYDLAGANNMDGFASLLQESRPVGMALIDLAGLDQRIWAHCQVLRERGIPFVLIAHQQSPALQKACHQAGAREILVKPLAPKGLLAIIQSLVPK